MKKSARVLSLCLALLMMLMMVPFTGATATTETIAAGQSKKLVFDGVVAGYEFAFTPTKTARYAFFSESDLDMVGMILDDEGNEIAHGDDTQAGYDFYLSDTFTAGTTYTLRAEPYDVKDEIGDCTIHLTEYPTEVEIDIEGGDAITVPLYGEGTLNINLTFGADPDQAMTWSSDNMEVLEVTSYGNYIALAVGTANISVTTEDGLTDTAIVTVVEPTQVIKVGEPLKLDVSKEIPHVYKFVAPKDVEYCIHSTGEADIYVTVYDGNETVASDDDGAAGLNFKANFVAEKGKTYYISMGLYHENEEVTTVYLTEAAPLLEIIPERTKVYGYVGEYLNVGFTFFPINHEELVYEKPVSSDPSVVSIDDGIQLLKAGVATLSITVNGVTTKIEVEVMDIPVLELNKSTLIEVGKASTAVYQFTPTADGIYRIGTVNGMQNDLSVYKSDGSFVEVKSANYGDDNVEKTYELTAGVTYKVYVYSLYQDKNLHIYAFSEDSQCCAPEAHEWDIQVIQKASRTATGEEKHTCKTCGLVLNVVIPMLEKDALEDFADVKNKWYYEAVNKVYQEGLMGDAGKGGFEPNSKMTRGMFVTILGRLHGVDTSAFDAKSGFSDVKSGKYYTKYVTWASKAGIVNGVGGGKFAPNANVTRQEICKMLVTYCEYTGIGLRAVNEPITFTDAGQIAGWAKKYVAACQTAGLVQGSKDGKGYKFNPKGLATRAEVATMITNLMENYTEEIYLGAMGGMGGI